MRDARGSYTVGNVYNAGELFEGGEEGDTNVGGERVGAGREGGRDAEEEGVDGDTEVTHLERYVFALHVQVRNDIVEEC